MEKPGDTTVGDYGTDVRIEVKLSKDNIKVKWTK